MLNTSIRLRDLLFDWQDVRIQAGLLDMRITHLSDDSRTVRPGSLFIARLGSQRDGRAYVSEALRRGAVAVLLERNSATDMGKVRSHHITQRQSANSTSDVGSRTNGNTNNIENFRIDANEAVTWVEVDHLAPTRVGQLAERFFGHPAKQLKLIGVTGTNGKTTTAYLIQHLLNQAGQKCGLISTVALDDGVDRMPAQLTTPGAIEFSRLLAAMARNGCRAVVSEVSSHALAQGRTSAVSFDVAVFTNLTGDHLDYHGSMDNYAAAKANLFEQLESDNTWAVVNADDPYGQRIVRDSRSRVLWTSVEDSFIDGRHPSSPRINQTYRQRSVQDHCDSQDNQRHEACYARILELGMAGSRVCMDGPWGQWFADIPLVGRHNVSNAIQALGAVYALVDSDHDRLRLALDHCPSVPGRLEPVRVKVTSKSIGCPTVIVDFAHTHDALENVLQALRRIIVGHVVDPTIIGNDHQSIGRLTVIFGAGGDRDRTKRPKMAAVACRLADRVVITSDNPRTEEPLGIINDILKGVPSEAQDRVTTEPDRAKAIADTVMTASLEDVILIAGKGHEDYQIIGTAKHPFDDRIEATAALKRWVNNHDVVDVK